VSVVVGLHTPVAEDHFRAFLDRLGAAVGIDATTPPVHGGVAPGAMLADEAHLSRFHFDRVIAAVAGESPSRFRQRILLERAAYQLVTTDRPILEVAVGAGFGSHEAFTRAFRRHHGRTPSLWRRAPGSFRIEARSDVHFHPPGGLRIPARHRMDSMDLILEMVDHHVWLVGRFVDLAARVGDADLDEPMRGTVALVDDESLRWVVSRLIGQMAMWNAAVADEEYDFGVEDHESVLSMRRRLDVTAPQFASNVRRFATEGRFDETFVNAFGPEPTVLTHGAMVAHVLTFAAHHRLLAVARFAELGLGDLGLGDPKEWFAVGGVRP
jgi:AraC-like DNA-binding protein